MVGGGGDHVWGSHILAHSCCTASFCGVQTSCVSTHFRCNLLSQTVLSQNTQHDNEVVLVPAPPFCSCRRSQLTGRTAAYSANQHRDPTSTIACM